MRRAAPRIERRCESFCDPPPSFIRQQAAKIATKNSHGVGKNCAVPHHALCFAQDDGSVVVGTDLALLAGMEERSLADRVKMVEDKLGTKTLEEHFREHAELIDRRFDESLREQAELLDQRFMLVDQRFDRVDATLAGLRKDMAIVREGVSTLLKRDRT